ncbi:MAG: putative redox-active protein (C_GCAxxG_C_C) [Syntrophus sp. PtaU1.Bin208]|nr:MAG: putative redox-active protein (C_GCAxxG_C_C) [Syntrophus sp. PtaU1.Bin208]
MTSMTEEKAARGFKEGFDCSQQVLAWAAERHSLGMDRKEALKIAASFGGGMWNGDTCGCVSGALMAIGLKYGHCESGDKEAKALLKAKTAEFEKRFLERNGSLICRNLLGYNLTVPEDLEKIMEKNLFFTVCTGLICSACEILEEVL